MASTQAPPTSIASPPLTSPPPTFSSDPTDNRILHGHGHGHDPRSNSQGKQLPPHQSTSSSSPSALSKQHVLSSEDMKDLSTRVSSCFTEPDAVTFSVCSSPYAELLQTQEQQRQHNHPQQQHHHYADKDLINPTSQYDCAKLSGTDSSASLPMLDVSPSFEPGSKSDSKSIDSGTSDRSVVPGPNLDQRKPEEIPPPVKSPKPAWGRTSSNAVRSSEPSPVMGALSWPALSEAKAAPDLSKPAQTQNAPENLQAPSPISTGSTGNLTATTRKQKASSQPDSTNNGIAFAAQASSDAQATNPVKVPTDVDHADNTERVGRGIRHANNGIGVNQRGNVPGSNNVGGNRRSFLRDQGRGNHGWHSHGRGYANGRDNNIPFQQQRVGPRNLPRPFFPYMTPTPSFVNAVGYQSVPGNMYYMAAPPPDPLLAATYFGPSAVQGVFMSAPEPAALQTMLVKQIEYYFRLMEILTLKKNLALNVNHTD